MNIDLITLLDLPDALRAADFVAEMVAGANAQAARVAPCLVSNDPVPSEDQQAEARLILLGAVKRWLDVGAGGISQRTEVKGPFTESETVDTRQVPTGWRLWPSEINQLQEICKGDDEDTNAFAVDTAPLADCSPHADICSLNFGATYCSCGAVLTNLVYPLYERCD